MLPAFPIGTVVRLNARGWRHRLELSQHGGAGMEFGDGLLTATFLTIARALLEASEDISV